MKEIDFTHGRLSFSLDSFEMRPCLPDTVERRIQLFRLDGELGFVEQGFHDFDALDQVREECNFVWLHLSGSLGAEFFAELKRFLDLDDEQVKHLRSPHRRSFFEDDPNALFWTMQRPAVTQTTEVLETINFILCQKVMVTRQFSHDNAFAMVAHKLMSKAEQLTDLSVDGLAAELIEDMINSYVEVLQFGGTRLEEIQNKVIRRPGKQELYLINRAQQVIWIYMNAAWPIETVIQTMLRSRNPLLSKRGKEEIGYRLEEASAVLRLFETYRAMSYNLMDVYVSGLGLKTNETTMILTVIATLFLPPTLIAGIYGMNFQIPEIHVAWGYYFCLGAMVMVSGGLLFWLKRRGFIDF